MSASERYRTLAGDAARAASNAISPKERAAWREIAESWERLAREAEALETAVTGPEPKR
ncbi:MAG: hypothetical protein JSR45_13895 [Proteobacteria bacterium]|nr:hypothetical protein [Pseudomonadota bacterium]